MIQFAPVYPVLHRVLPPLFPLGLWQGDRSQPVVALTIDDGPHPVHTPALLEVLHYNGILASFFLLGQRVERYQLVVRAIWEQGHWLGLHGYTHRMFPEFSSPDLKQQLAKTQAAIAQACGWTEDEGRSRLRDVRPPNGVFTPGMLQQLHTWGYRPVMWTVVPEDWVRPGIEICVQRILSQVSNGSIIVLHDGVCGGEDVAAIAQLVIPELRWRGYQFVTIDQLWADSHHNEPTASTSPSTRPLD